MENMVMDLHCWQKKRVLVTGHTGFKGSWLAAWLQMLNAEVIGIALEPTTQPSHFDLLQLDLESHILDIRDEKALSILIKKIKPEVVFHMAAQPLVRDSYIFPLETIHTNVLGTANILNVCRDVESLKAIVVVTSDKCYENKEWIWGYRETDSVGGYDPYSASKGCAEIVTASFRNSFFNLSDFGKSHQALIASARAGNVIGGGDWSKDRLIPDIMRAVAGHQKVQIRSPKAIRPWQHVLDCLSGYLCLAEKLMAGEQQFAQAWNFGPGDAGIATVLDVVNIMKKTWPKVNYDIDINKTHPHEASLLKLDCSKARTLLNWVGRWSLSESIMRTIQWYQNYYEDNKIMTRSQIGEYMHRIEIGC